MTARLGPLIIDIEGTTLAAREREMLCHPWVGGLIYFSRNFESRDQIRALSHEIQNTRRQARLGPLLIAVDHEGGRVQRFRDGFHEIPAMCTLGALWKDDNLDQQFEALARARALGRLMAQELADVGVGFSFAPVLDLNYGRSQVIGERAFHADPAVVARLASAFMHGLSLSGFRNCAKHFPGHGFSSADSHLELPIDDRPLEKILAMDCAPYGWLGSSAISAVMPAHIRYVKVDDRPAGFSPIWLKDILRKRLGFQGVIISDDLAMAGAAEVIREVTDRAQSAFSAGCDAALICNSPDLVAQVLEELPRRLPEFLHTSARQGLEGLLPLTHNGSAL